MRNEGSMKNNRVWVAPSILTADFSEIGREIKKINTADMIHIDVMDGMFVPNITFGPKFVADLKKCTRKPLDVHLMIGRPQRYIDAFIKAGADYLTVHYEACGSDLNTVLKDIKAAGVKCGAVINPLTPCEAVFDSLAHCNIVLLMSVNPGFGGQSFIDSVLGKINIMREFIDANKLKTLVEVDGGVNEKYAPLCAKMGADILVAGNYVFGAENPKSVITELKKLRKK